MGSLVDSNVEDMIGSETELSLVNKCYVVCGVVKSSKAASS